MGDGRKSTKESGDDVDRAVIATNDDAFESKVAAMDVGYFADRYLASMRQRQRDDHAPLLGGSAATRYRRQPVISRGTYARIAIKERMVRACLAQLGRGGASPVQIVSLGAGFDTFAFKLLDAWKAAGDRAGPCIDYVELDLAPVVRAKMDVAADFLICGGPLFDTAHVHEAGFHGTVDGNGAAGVNGSDTMRSSSYRLGVCDLRDASRLRETLVDACGLDVSRPTLIVAEIALVYMRAADSDAAIAALCRALRGTRVFLNLEQVGCADDAFTTQMQRNFDARGSPLYGVLAYPDLAAQQARFQRLGWHSSCRALSMLHAFSACLSAAAITALHKVQLLDEMEEFNLLLLHYCVVVAVRLPDVLGDDAGVDGIGRAVDVEAVMDWLQSERDESKI